MLEKNISETLKTALKEKDQVKVSVLRMLISDIKNRKIADKTQDKELDDEKVIAVIKKMVRRYKEAIEKFTEGGREDLVSKEAEELKVLETYLPEEMSEEELAKIIDEAIAATGAASPGDMGKVMSAVMGKVQGRADGKVISALVKEKLSGV